MKKIIIIGIISLVCILSGVTISSATMYIVYGTQLFVYAQSTGESEANLVRSSKGIYNGGNHPWCGNRAYIEFADEELFKRALAAEVTGASVNIMYEDASPSRHILGHIQTRCKITSIWK
jgi:hypothetical protein